MPPPHSNGPILIYPNPPPPPAPQTDQTSTQSPASLHRASPVNITVHSPSLGSNGVCLAIPNTPDLESYLHRRTTPRKRPSPLRGTFSDPDGTGFERILHPAVPESHSGTMTEIP